MMALSPAQFSQPRMFDPGPEGAGQVWFHMGTEPEFEPDRDEWMHVGTGAAANHRGRRYLNVPVREYPPDTPLNEVEWGRHPGSTLHLFRITGPMQNTPSTPVDDADGNAYGEIRRSGQGRYYTNMLEDRGSISAVVPRASHLEHVESHRVHATPEPEKTGTRGYQMPLWSKLNPLQ